jgi:hypothetical protein
MKLWHRAPREVYRVYGEEEYLIEEHEAVEEIHPTGETDRLEDRRATVSSLPHSSRTARLVGLGLLVGVSVGAVGLVVFNMAHRASAPPPLVVSRGARTHLARGASVAGPGFASRHASVAGRTFAGIPAGSERAIRRSAGSRAGHAPSPTYAPSGFAASPRASGSPAAARPHVMSSRQSKSFPEEMAGWRSQGDSPALSGTAAPASPGGEFEFER